MKTKRIVPIEDYVGMPKGQMNTIIGGIITTVDMHGTGYTAIPKPVGIATTVDMMGMG